MRDCVTQRRRNCSCDAGEKNLLAFFRVYLWKNKNRPRDVLLMHTLVHRMNVCFCCVLESLQEFDVPSRFPDRTFSYFGERERRVREESSQASYFHGPSDSLS